MTDQAPSSFIKIHSDYGWIGRIGWHNTIDCVPTPLPGAQWFRIWGMSCWFPFNWGPRVPVLSGEVEA